MKKFLLTALTGATLFCASAAVPDYDQASALQKAQSDVANWMSYLPDDVFVAHVSIPGTHDAATGHSWDTATGSSNSTTQEKTLDEQLAGGIRAFDFRPGMNNGKLYCNHGVDRLKLTLEEAFTKLTDYLDAHPTEFYVIHLFRGNVYSLGSKPTGSGLLGAKDDASSIEQYNNLFNEFFNKGKFNDYIVEYNPMLKVKDIRGKMVIFRRDRIDFAHVAKAGNVQGWPGDAENWTEGSVKAVINASDATISGRLQATDVSSPKNDSELEVELNSLTNLYNYNASLGTPNDLKRVDIAYRPHWTMMFTSGALYNENTKGYLDNATHTNPHFTNLLKEACAAGKAGPTGTVFSDWVLTDSHKYNSSTYATMGVELVPTIIANNFYYIGDYILDDELFKQSEAEMYWDESKEYYMRNVETGLFLAGGQWWGTHAILSEYGLKVKPLFDASSGTYTLRTNIGSNGGYGTNDYVDNGDSHLNLIASRAGLGRYTFTTTDGSKALTAVPTSGFLDGTKFSVQQSSYVEGNAYQQWELILVDEYYNSVIEDASMSNGVDISFRMGRWMQNDSEACNSWSVTKGKSTSGGLQGQTGGSDNKLMLYFNNANKGTFAVGWDASWSVSKDITGIPNGVYTMSWDALVDNIFNLTMTVNGTNVENQIKSVGSAGDISHVDAATKLSTGEYTCTTAQFVVTDNQIQIRINNPSHSSKTAAAFDNFRLIYYGPDPTATCEFLQKVIGYATAKVRTLDAEYQEGWDEAMAPYKAIVESKNIIGDGTSEANDIYSLLRERVYRNTTEGANYTAAIINNSFEWGTTYGWTVITSDDTNVYPNTNNVYHTDNCDGDYLFNTWSKGTPVTQLIPALPAGHYRLQALAVTGDTNEDRYVYLLANDRHSDAIKVSNDKVTMTEVAWEFDVPATGNVTIGLLGAKADGSFDEYGDQWYKADNFRLTYLGEPEMDTFYDALRAAIDYATSHVNSIPESYREGWTEAMQPYEDIITNKTLEGDGSKEIEEIYSLMRNYVLSQKFAGADFTPAIVNHSFEWASTQGWTVAEVRGDTGVKPNSDSTYAIDNCDGDYLYNTWDNQGNFGSAISQTLPNAPAGRYRLEALLTSDAGKTLYLTANGFRSAIASNVKTHGEEAVLEFTLTEPTDLTIGASSRDAWYKADNFRLTYVGPMLTTVNWTATGMYDTLILPFECEVPDHVTVYEASLDPVDFTEGFNAHVLSLKEVGTIEANTPYLVEVADVESDVPMMMSRRSAGSYATDDFVNFTFTGEAVNDADSYTKGVLTGTLTGASVTKEDGHYLLKNGYFEQHTADEAAAVEANHAYIANDASTQHPLILVKRDIVTGIGGVTVDGDEIVTVYTMTGAVVKKEVTLRQALETLDAGVYVLSNGMKVIK